LFHRTYSDRLVESDVIAFATSVPSSFGTDSENRFLCRLVTELRRFLRASEAVVRHDAAYSPAHNSTVSETLMSARSLLTLSFATICLLLPTAAVGQDDVTITPDIVYGHKDGMALTLDKYVPAGETNGGAIVFMVSGGWVSKWAPPEALRGLFAPYLENGFTVFSVRHGSSPRYGIPDAVADVRRSIRFIRLHAEDYDIDANRIGVLGMSAGGHLSLVLATTGDDGDPDATDPVLQTSSRVATVAALVPPTDLRVAVWEAEESLPAYRNFPALNLPLAEAGEYSPVVHVTPDDAPALVISGTLDELVPSRHGQWIADAYTKQKVPVKLMLLEANHGLAGKQTEAFEAIQLWFIENLNPPKSVD